MLKVAYIHFSDDTARAPRSGWYVVDELGTIVVGTSRFDHQASAMRALNAALNAPVFA